ncbi:hypothetical protein V9T40_005964 [Parthenolecanium corni]|uniref:Uncharacterized protein n=1 Tax=Parthenolecanium corni TaxID=536013 RepID=A0AAN9U449_9HEMI
MNIFPFLPTLVVCFAYLSLTSSKPLEPSSDENLKQGLLELGEKVYCGFLLYSIAAASSGKNFFQMSENVNEDCVRTSRVIMHSFVKPSTVDTVVYIMNQSVHEAAKNKLNSTFHSQVNTVCQYLNEQAKKRQSTFPSFEEHKTIVEIPKLEKNYIFEMPFNQSIKDWANSTQMKFDDPEIIKFEVIIQLFKFRNLTSAKDQREFIGIAKAIRKLSRTASYMSEVDRIFKETLEDFIKNFSAQNTDEDKNITLSSAFVQKVDQNFLSNLTLKEEYQKIKQEAIDEVPT